MPKIDKDYPRWMYPPEFPAVPERLVQTPEEFDRLTAEGWHKDTKFLNLKTALRAEVKKFEKLLADRKERLAALEGDRPEDSEDQDVERTCNACGMVFFTKLSYDEHMDTHRAKKEED